LQIWTASAIRAMFAADAAGWASGIWAMLPMVLVVLP
jgi:hypothetical protein